MKNDLELKRDLMTALESDLAKAMHWNSQISDPFHKCDVDLSKYIEMVGQMSDRWRRIQTQIDSRYMLTYITGTFTSSTRSLPICNPLMLPYYSYTFLSRLWDLEKQEKQLNHYQQSSTSLEDWMDNARKRQDSLQMAKFTDIQTLMDHLNKQKARTYLFH